MDKQVFFYEIRGQLFDGSLNQEQVDGIETILDAWELYGTGDRRHLAYILATSYWETGRRMIPVREGQGQRKAWTDKQARRAVELIFQKGVISRNYALPESNGNSYYGRGHVQLTHGANYKRMGEILGLDLYGNPDLALDPEVSARILVEGVLKAESTRGDFTAFALEDFIHDDVADYYSARKTVNGLDKARQIADYAVRFENALEAAESEHEVYRKGSTPPANVRPGAEAPTRPAPALPQEVEVVLQPFDADLLQRRLHTLGYHEVGNVDAVIGGKTRTGVMRFKSENGMPATGIITQEFLDLVYDMRVAPAEQGTERESTDVGDIEAKDKTGTSTLGKRLLQFGAGLFGVSGLSGVLDGTGTLDDVTAAIGWVGDIAEQAQALPAWVYLLGIGGAVAFFGWEVIQKQIKAYREGRVR